jgi:hypothetical protein
LKNHYEILQTPHLNHRYVATFVIKEIGVRASNRVVGEDEVKEIISSFAV